MGPSSNSYKNIILHHDICEVNRCQKTEEEHALLHFIGLLGHEANHNESKLDWINERDGIIFRVRKQRVTFVFWLFVKS